MRVACGCVLCGCVLFSGAMMGVVAVCVVCARVCKWVCVVGGDGVCVSGDGCVCVWWGMPLALASVTMSCGRRVMYSPTTTTPPPPPTWL